MLTDNTMGSGFGPREPEPAVTAVGVTRVEAGAAANEGDLAQGRSRDRRLSRQRRMGDRGYRAGGGWTVGLW